MIERKSEENEYFEKHANNYADDIMAIQPTLYLNTANLINNATKTSAKVLDIGNGGVINYKFDHFLKLTCGDLFVSKTAVKKYQDFSNVEFVRADILDLNFADAEFDTIIVSTVIHHLAASSFRETQKNVDKAIQECLRVLKPGGSLLIVESTVNRTFELIERLLYPFMQMFFKICKFDSVYQYSAQSLLAKLSALGNIVDHSSIDIGPYIWIMGKKVPTRITPCGAEWIRMMKK